MAKTEARHVGQDRRKITPRVVIAFLLGAVSVVLLVENRASTRIHLLVTTVTMPLWLALLLMFAIGLALGWLLRRRRREPR